MTNPPNADARSDLPGSDTGEALDAREVSGRDFLDPGVDFSGEAFSPDEKRALLQWYRDVHDIGDLDLAPFARFSLEHDPVGFKRLRRHVMTFDEPVEGTSLPLFIGPLLYVHTYTAMGHGKGRSTRSSRSGSSAFDETRYSRRSDWRHCSVAREG